MNNLELILEYMKSNPDSLHFKQEITENFYPKSSFYECCDECSSENIYDNHRISRKTNKREFGYVCNDCGYDYYDGDEETSSEIKHINSSNLAKQMIFDVAMEIQYKAEKLSDEEIVNKLLHALKLLDTTNKEEFNE